MSLHDIFTAIGPWLSDVGHAVWVYPIPWKTLIIWTILLGCFGFVARLVCRELWAAWQREVS